MLVFLITTLAFAIAVMAFVARPLMRAHIAGRAGAQNSEMKLQSRLDTIETDRAFDLIDAERAIEAVAEARTTARESQAADNLGNVSRVGRSAAALCLGAAPLAAVFLYFNIGAPQAFDQKTAKEPSAVANTEGMDADQAAAIAAMPDEDRRAMIESMVESLAERLKQEPGDADGWRMLARSYAVLGRSAESASAWRELLKIDGGGVEDWRQYAYALADDREAGDTSVSVEMETAFTRLRAFDADDPLALFVLGHAAFNRGDIAGAKAMWSRLREILPGDTPVSPTLDRLLEQVQ